MSATIEFDVSDTSAEIVENTASLGEANSVVVTGTAKADALNEAEYQALLTEMTGDGATLQVILIEYQAFNKLLCGRFRGFSL